MNTSARYISLCCVVINCLYQACTTASPDLIKLGTIQIRAGDHDRRGLPAKYPCSLNQLLNGKVLVRENDAIGLPNGYDLFLVEQGRSGSAIPAQWDTATSFPWEKPGDGILVWIMDEHSAAGSIRSFDLVLKPRAAISNSFTVEDSVGGRLVVRSGHRQVLQYNYGIVRQSQDETGPYDRAAYIHPVWTPRGPVITGDFSPEHIHQRGLFMAFRRVRFGELETDFWGLGESKGRILPDEAKPKYAAGPVFAKLTIHNKGEVSGRTYLKEVWGVRIYQINRSDLWLFDIIVRQLPVDSAHPEVPPSQPSEMVLEQIHYGGMSYRGPSNWLHRDGRDVTRALAQGLEFPDIEWLPQDVELDVLTSEKRTRTDGDAKPARWVDYTGPVEDGWGGLVMYSHPSNLRHPMPVRIHPELPYFSWALTQDASLTVNSDHSLDQRFRVLVHDGHPDERLNERFGSDYTDPVEVVFEASD